jgi:glycine/D-amino acid oxidase-like deaminating enzyme
VPSFWLSRAGRPEEVETVVVGAGIVGLSTAYWLTRSGRRPLVLDADGVASHASGRNAGYLMTGTAEPYTWLVGEIGEAAAFRLWELSSENRELLRGELLDAGKIDVLEKEGEQGLVGTADARGDAQCFEPDFVRSAAFGIVEGPGLVACAGGHGKLVERAHDAVLKDLDHGATSRFCRSDRGCRAASRREG